MKAKSFTLCMMAILSCGLVSCGEATSSIAETSSSSVETSPLAYKAGRDVFSKQMTYNNAFNYSLNCKIGQGHLPSIGQSKMLVVPVFFSDNAYTAEKTASVKETIDKAFFGESDSTGWESVKSYYYKSSFGKLDLQGEVSEPVKMTKTFEEYDANRSKTYNTVNTICANVYKALFTGDSPKYKVSDFDSDSDGVVDSMYLVYDAPIDSAGEGLGWAFTTWYNHTIFDYPIGTYAWSSFNFMVRRPGYTVSKPDAHTYIHESGHLLGLNDYYDTYNSSRSPAGGNTMQDCNICDHESYSKYLWGWNDPRVVTDENTEKSISITLKPAEDSGDCLVLAGEFNHTSLDEYLMIDYYTPTKLNEKDSTTTYESVKGIDQAGIRIWHVDKRIYTTHIKVVDKNDIEEYDPNEVEDVNMAKDVDTSTSDVIDFYECFSTNGSKNYDADGAVISTRPELELMRATYGTSNYKLSDAATGADLFKAGSTFGTNGDAFKDFEFYSCAGSNLDYDCTVDDYNSAAKVQLPYTIKVDSIGDTAKLTLTKKI